MDNVKFLSSAVIVIVAPVVLLGILVCISIVTLPLYRQTVATLPEPHIAVADSDTIARSVILHTFFSTPLTPDIFSPGEQRHLRDIHILAVTVTRFFLVSLIVFLTAGAHLHNTDRRLLYCSIASSMGIVSIVSLILAYFVGGNFDFLFEYFHKLTFKNGDWQFDPTIEKLIVVFPPQLFYSILIGIVAALIIFSGTLCVYFYTRYKRS